MAIKSIPIELDKRRELRYQGPDLADMEQALGKGVLTVLQEQPFFAMKMLLHYGLKWQDSRGDKMTTMRAAELMQVWMDDGHTFEELTEKVTDALKLSGFVGEKLKSEADAEGNAQPEAP